MSSNDIHQVKELTLAEAYRRIKVLEDLVGVGLRTALSTAYGGEPGREAPVSLPAGRTIPVGLGGLGTGGSGVTGPGSIQTFTGLEFTPMEPQGHLITVRDIAHALSNTCRYGGHTTRFYSVAEHVVLMARALMAAGATRDEVLWALHHDDPEAYIGDLVRPLKRSFPGFTACEDRIMTLVRRLFGMVSTTMPARVVEADNRILIDERAQALAPTEKVWTYSGATEPLGVTIEFWEPRRAEWEYIRLHNELSGGDVPLPVWPVEPGWVGSIPTPTAAEPAAEPADNLSDDIPEQLQRIIDVVKGVHRPRELPAPILIRCSWDPAVTQAQMEYNIARTADGYAASVGGRVSELSIRHESELDKRGMRMTVVDFTVVPLPGPDKHEPKYEPKYNQTSPPAPSAPPAPPVPPAPPEASSSEKIHPDRNSDMGLAMGLALGGDVSLLNRLSAERRSEAAESLSRRTQLETQVSEEMLERIESEIRSEEYAPPEQTALGTARSALSKIRTMAAELRVSESHLRPLHGGRMSDMMSKIEDLAVEAFCETSPAWNPEPTRRPQSPPDADLVRRTGALVKLLRELDRAGLGLSGAGGLTTTGPHIVTEIRSALTDLELTLASHGDDQGSGGGVEGTVAATEGATPATAVPSVLEGVIPDESHQRGFNHGLEYALQLFKVSGQTSQDVFETIHETRYGARPTDPAPQLDPLGRDFVEAAVRVMQAYPGFDGRDYIHDGISADDFESMFTEDMQEAWREVERFRDQVVTLTTAVVDVERHLTNMQPHIEQACLPGHAGFLDNYVDPCLQILQAVTGRESGLDYRSYLPALERVAGAAGDLDLDVPDTGTVSQVEQISVQISKVWSLGQALSNLATIRAGYTNRAVPRGSRFGRDPLPEPDQGKGVVEPGQVRVTVVVDPATGSSSTSIKIGDALEFGQARLAVVLARDAVQAEISGSAECPARDGGAGKPTPNELVTKSLPGPALAVAIDRWGTDWVANEAGGLVQFAEAFNSLSGAEVRRQRYDLKTILAEDNDSDEAMDELVDRITEVFRPIKRGA